MNKMDVSIAKKRLDTTTFRTSISERREYKGGRLVSRVGDALISHLDDDDGCTC